MNVQFVGLDLGQAQDPTALVLLERPLRVESYINEMDSGWYAASDVPSLKWVDLTRRSPELHLRALRRWQLGTGYPQIVQDVANLLSRLPHPQQTALVIDWTGVGRPVFDMFVVAGLAPIGIAIHGGDKVIAVDGGYRVPARDLAGAVQSLLQRRHLKFAADLPLLGVLKGELQNFRVKIDPATAHDSYSAWRENQHDDCVLATAVAAWYAERVEVASFATNYVSPPRRAAR
jgi:hypothetical protein